MNPSPRFYQVGIIGAGPSSCFLAMHLDPSIPTIIFDKNPGILTKFLMTGAGHANLTNMCDPTTLLANYVYGQKNFFKYALAQQPNHQLLAWLNSHHLDFEYKKQTKVHLIANNTTVRKHIKNQLDQNPNLTYCLHTPVSQVKYDSDSHTFLLITKDQVYQVANLVIATGGKSFSKATGCTGDGYVFAQQLGHQVTPLYPMGVGIELSSFPPILDLGAGFSLADCVGKVKINHKVVACETNDLMITHQGIGGPLTRRLSGYLTHNCLAPEPLEVSLDLLDDQASFVKQLQQAKHFHELWKQYPKFNKKFIAHFYELNQVNGETELQNLTKQKINQIIACFFDLKLDVKLPAVFSQKDFEGAINTGGGVNTKEINPMTFESKLISGLYFVGEVLDVNAKTGGFNLTACYASGTCCAHAINAKYQPQ